jgi:hypothetical protein
MQSTYNEEKSIIPNVPPVFEPMNLYIVLSSSNARSKIWRPSLERTDKASALSNVELVVTCFAADCQIPHPVKTRIATLAARIETFLNKNIITP